MPFQELNGKYERKHNRKQAYVTRKLTGASFKLTTTCAKKGKS